MNGEILYLIGTAVSWVGWIAVAFALYRAVDALMKPRGVARQRSVHGFISAGATGAISLLIAAAMPMPGGIAKPGWRLPLVWPIMPFAAWAALVCFCFAVYRVFQLILDRPARTHALIPLEDDIDLLEDPIVAEGSETRVASEAESAAGKSSGGTQLLEAPSPLRTITPPLPPANSFDHSSLSFQSDEHRARLRQAIGAFIIALGFFWIFKKSGDTVDIVRGGIPFQPGTAVALILFAVLALIAMAIAAQYTASRGVAKKVVLHTMMVVGSIVFGLPFLWLVITSFKEDQDMSSANGLVWIPKVTEQMPYRDPANPYYQGSLNGETVLADVIEHEPDGKLKLNIAHPMSLQGETFDALPSQLKEVDRMGDVVSGTYDGQPIKGHVVREFTDGKEMISVLTPASLANQTFVANPGDLQKVRHVGLKWQNYPDALDYLPPEAHEGLTYLENTLILVIFNVIGTILSSSLVAYAFARFRFPGKNFMFTVLISTMMLPAAITLLPQFLIFKSLGWIDTLYPLWVPAFFASAFNVFLLRQFFMTIPKELEDASKIDGCSYLKTFWSVMLPQVKPALAVIGIWTFMAVWNNFMGPLVYINSPEHMPISYAVQLYQGDRSGEPGLLMAFATMSMLPVLALFFGAQKYFIEGVTLSGLGGR